MGSLNSMEVEVETEVEAMNAKNEKR